MTNDFDSIIEGRLQQLAAAGLMAGALSLSPNAQAAPKTASEYSNITTDPFLAQAFEYIGRNEQNLTKDHYMPYVDTKTGKMAIGVGHSITRGEDFSKGITKEQAIKLFSKDVQKHLIKCRALFPKYDSYPTPTKIAILDGVYRGDLSGSKRTIKLINLGRWVEAAKEYINNKEYRASKQKGPKHGVWMRMDRNATKLAATADKLTESDSKTQLFAAAKRTRTHPHKKKSHVKRGQSRFIMPGGQQPWRNGFKDPDGSDNPNTYSPRG